MPFALLFSAVSLLSCMTLLNPSDSIKSVAQKNTGEKSMSGSIQFELTGAIKLSRRLDIKTCLAQKTPVPLFSAVTASDETFKDIQIQLPEYKGSGKYVFTGKNWPIIGGSLPASLIAFNFQDGSLLNNEGEAEVEFIVNDDEAKSGVVTFKGYRGMQFSQSESQLVNRGVVQGTIRWKCD
jgi:hypothetical protein